MVAGEKGVTRSTDEPTWVTNAPEDKSTPPQWPGRLQALALEIRATTSEVTRERARGEAWLLLNAALLRYLRSHATKVKQASREDLEDIAAHKSLELLKRISSGAWEMNERSAKEVCGYLASVARHGLFDFLGEAVRRVRPREEDRPEWEVKEATLRLQTAQEESPDVPVERKEFAARVVHCVGQLAPRAQLIWFFRVFLGLSSKEIAVHPEIRLKSSHVDVLLQRSRKTIRDCLEQVGYRQDDMPPGTFVEIWKSLRFTGGASGVNL